MTGILAKPVVAGQMDEGWRRLPAKLGRRRAVRVMGRVATRYPIARAHRRVAAGVSRPVVARPGSESART